MDNIFQLVRFVNKEESRKKSTMLQRAWLNVAKQYLFCHMNDGIKLMYIGCFLDSNTSLYPYVRHLIPHYFYQTLKEPVFHK